MEDKELQLNRCIDDFARRSFRNVADQDYILARMCLRDGLVGQFAWQSLQALEKYLKGILLFNRQNTKKRDDAKKNYSHNIIALTESVEALDELNFKLPKECRGFLEYSCTQGVNRYSTSKFTCKGHQLHELDEIVSFIRRYCQPIHEGQLIQDVTSIDRFAHFFIPNGYLEETLQKPDNPQCISLLWRNKVFNPECEEVNSRYASWSKPLLHFYPEHFDEISKIVQFSPQEKSMYLSMINRNTTNKSP
ncbi:hypothetical protein [Marinomonas primoryensis]|uniref:HEPN domain-containing protein n=1 Tax=Marinomonas primoryensis TaxID=178399 RepID=A0ABV0KX41_9GAMM